MSALSFSVEVATWLVGEAQKKTQKKTQKKQPRTTGGEDTAGR